MVKLDILLDEPSIDLSSGFQSRATDVPLSGRLVISLDKPTQFKSASLKYECINSHVDLEGEVYVYYNLHRAMKVIPLGVGPLSAGSHSFPFTFLVPRNLPPSLFASYGAVNHRIRARVKRVGHVPNLLCRMKGAATARINLVVHNSDHSMPNEALFHRPASPDDPPAYSSNRRQWSGQRRNGAIDWSIQGPDSAHISHRIEVLAKLRIATGYGTVSSATVDLVQAERYVAEPDPTVWTFPIQEQLTDDDSEIAWGSDDGYPETRTSGVKLRKSIALAPFGANRSGICRENRSIPVQSVTKAFPPPPDPSSDNTGYNFHLAISLPLPDNGELFPTHASPLISISHRIRVRFTFFPEGTKELGMILPIIILPAPTPNIFHASAVAELNFMHSAANAEDFWMVLVEEEGRSGPHPERAVMESGGNTACLGLPLPPEYDDDWRPNTQQRRGSIQMAIAR